MKRWGRTWRAEELAQAAKMQEGGLTFAEIGKALNRTERAVQCALLRYGVNPRTVFQHPYLRDLDGPPIGTCDDALNFKRNAIVGSAKLLAEIERVFGKAA